MVDCYFSYFTKLKKTDWAPSTFASSLFNLPIGKKGSKIPVLKVREDIYVWRAVLWKQLDR
jgi:hypothetical protein